MKTETEKDIERQIEETPECPRCRAEMRLRRSQNGEFWGCSRFPECRGTRPAAPGSHQNFPAPKKLELIPGSKQQESVWEFMRSGTEHGLVEARAGSGKTFSIVQGVMRMPRNVRIGIFSFNNHIVKELSNQLKSMGMFWVNAFTYNAFGHRAVMHAFPQARLDQGKLEDLFNALKDDDYSKGGTAFALTRLCKNLLITNPNEKQLRDLAERYGIDMRDSDVFYVPKMLANSLTHIETFDFDDQVFWTVVKDLPVQTFDMLLIDEAQDTNKLQQEIAKKACPSGRIIVVGDRHQSIYGFRGADVDAIPSLFEWLEGTERGCKIFPLTVTRRCPKSHIRLAKLIVPDIEAMDDAPEGEIVTMEHNAAMSEMSPGDLVMCRVNAPLISYCYALIASGVRATIRGRDIGKGLQKLINKLKPTTVPDLLIKIEEYYDKEVAKLQKVKKKKAASKIAALKDTIDCMYALAEGLHSIYDVQNRINKIFSDFDEDGKPRDAVVLGTIHRTKGLEANSVFILNPELIPHPAANQAWEREQERNMAYVAVTRAKFEGDKSGRLVFVGQIPPIYSEPDADDQDGGEEEGQ